MKTKLSPKGFTLIELLVVITIIVIVASLFFGVIKSCSGDKPAGTNPDGWPKEAPIQPVPNYYEQNGRN